MKSIFFKFKVFGLVTIYFFLSANSSFADDTEIFFTNNNTSAQIPNVLFIVDTSGSMRNSPQGSNDSRLAIVQDALIDILDNIDNVNVGLSRFSVPGGPILYPVTYIDTPVDPEVVSAIDKSTNDIEEYTNGSGVLINGTVLNLDVNNTIGLRFENIIVPQGATVTSATVSLTSLSDDSDPVEIEVYAEAADNSQPYTNAADAVSSRASTGNFVSWLPGPWQTDQTYATPDLSGVVQEVVNRSGWCGGNAMSFKFLHVNGDERTAYTYDRDTTYAATLRIKFSSSLPAGASGCIASKVVNQVADNDDDFEFTPGLSNDGNYLNMRSGNEVGLRFMDVKVPQSATISNAYITFNACDSDSSGSSNNIYGINADNAPNSNRDFESASYTTGVSWAPGAWQENRSYNTVNIKQAIQPIVNRAGWKSGNSLGIYIVPTSNERCGKTRDNSASRAPKLTIEYTGTYNSQTLTIREELKNAVRGLKANNWTPIADNMAEAGLYFRNEEVHYGKTRGGNGSLNDNRVSHPDSYSGGALYTPPGCTAANPNSSLCSSEQITGSPTYISPITEVCQSNHIVFLSDGEPTWMDSDTRSLYNRWSGGSCSNSPGNTSNGRGGDCAIKIAGFLNNNDQSDLNGFQSVRTHTIGFDIDSDVLRRMAAAGNGVADADNYEKELPATVPGYYTTNNKDGLYSAFQEIIGSILDINTSFVTSGLTVNQYNRLTHNDQLYYSLFKPTRSPVWEGNIKRYRLLGGQIVDVNDNPAVNQTTGEFKDTAHSWWASSKDGNEVIEGGVAEQQTVGRTLYSNLDAGSALTSATNTVAIDNNLITQAMLNASDDADRKETIEWALGYDLGDDARTTPHKIIGDPLHSRPTLINYNVGGVERTIIFVGTNNGYLHAFDASNGKEVWSFIPKELLDLLKISKVNDPSEDHNYGMDGEISIHIVDTNGNSAVDAGEKVYLYIGMRRGGESYYGFDISDFNSPKMLFGGPLNKDTDSDFNQLAQTWSRPVVARMNIGGQSDRLVLMFGAGYSTVHDTAGVASPKATTGNTVYIADALTGKKLWDTSDAIQAGGAGAVSSMDSVPGNIKAFDFDDDSLVDHFYVADMQGQIFRFDVNNTTQKIKGGRIAKLKTSESAVDSRRFFNSPDISLIRDKNTGKSYINIAIGSGYRAHPLDKITSEHMYVLRDRGVFTNTFEKDITLNDLVPLNGNIGDSDGDGISDVAEAINDPQSTRFGWYYDFQSTGEKVLAEALTFNNVLLFTTYVPPSGNASACEPASGKSRLYALNVQDGQPYVDTNYDGDIDSSDMFISLNGSGIAPKPQTTTTNGPDGAQTDLIVGRETIEGVLPMPPKRMMPIKWRHIQN
jgi:type IV pilus assembly protein PilY1